MTQRYGKKTICGGAPTENQVSEQTKKVAVAIIPAAGSGSRMDAVQPKQFAPLNGIPILALTLSRFLGVHEILSIIVPISREHHERVETILHTFFTPEQRHRIVLVTGGATRQESVRAGLKVVPDETEIVLVHDCARPFITAEIIERCIHESIHRGAAIAAVKVRDTIKQATAGTVHQTIDRSDLWQAQTPQAARADLLHKAFAQAKKDGFSGTDEASLLEHAGIPVTIVEGSELNFKITRPDDLILAAGITEEAMRIKVGHGFDAHKFKIGRQLILGGVSIPFDRGLEGHSDADVLTHALIDALLGAMGEGDIGRRFPDNDPRYININSLKLLEDVTKLAGEKKLTLVNADLTLICQFPKLAPYIDTMRQNLASACSANPDVVNIKATTTEMMGFTGRGEGIAAHAVVLIQNT